MVLLAPWAPPVRGQTPAGTPTPEATPRKKAREGQGGDLKRVYETLLKKPELIGFKPTQPQFRQILDIIHHSFVDPVTDEALAEGIQAALKEFLIQANVEPESLSLLEGVDLNHIFSRVQELYGRKVNPQLLGYVTMIGLIDGVKDSHSYLMTPRETAGMREQLRPSSFGGIGIYMEMDSKENALRVMEALEDTPAGRAGLQPGDLILKIDGKPTSGGQAMESLQSQIRGKIGSVVTLTLKRVDKVFDVPLQRAEIKTPILTSKIYPGDVGYIRLRIFGSEAATLFQEALDKLRSHSIKGLIFDLRNDGGGLVEVAVAIVGQFVPRDSLVVYTVNRRGERQDYRSRPGASPGGLGIPVIVMINENSASASEITAGALHDLNAATLVGDHSFGKGSVQMFVPLDGTGGDVPAMVRMTIAHFYTPKGQVINRQGIEPEVTVEMEPKLVGKEGQDVQLTQALEILRKQIGSAASEKKEPQEKDKS
jgi:carboxyl-terminal processing protease